MRADSTPDSLDGGGREAMDEVPGVGEGHFEGESRAKGWATPLSTESSSVAGMPVHMPASTVSHLTRSTVM